MASDRLRLRSHTNLGTMWILPNDHVPSKLGLYDWKVSIYQEITLINILQWHCCLTPFPSAFTRHPWLYRQSHTYGFYSLFLGVAFRLEINTLQDDPVSLLLLTSMIYWLCCVSDNLKRSENNTPRKMKIFTFTKMTFFFTFTMWRYSVVSFVECIDLGL